jgi:hypothetical protein
MKGCSVVGLVVSVVGMAVPIISVGGVVSTGVPWEGTRERFGCEEVVLVG